MCKDVTQIDSLPAMNMTMEIFSRVRMHRILQGVLYGILNLTEHFIYNIMGLFFHNLSYMQQVESL